jgi:hypothetical protein
MPVYQVVSGTAWVTRGNALTLSCSAAEAFGGLRLLLAKTPWGGGRAGGRLRSKSLGVLVVLPDGVTTRFQEWTMLTRCCFQTCV